MDADVTARAFEPFVTTKLGQGGTGLRIVRKLCAETLGGSVELDSAPDRGTRFAFQLPYVAPPAGIRAASTARDGVV